jgi:hypothetical protein
MANNVSSLLKWFKWIEKLSEKNLMSVILATSILLAIAYSFWATIPLVVQIATHAILAILIFATSILLIRYAFAIYYKIQLKKLLSIESATNVLKEIGEEAYKIV